MTCTSAHAAGVRITTPIRAKSSSASGQRCQLTESRSVDRPAISGCSASWVWYSLKPDGVTSSKSFSLFTLQNVRHPNASHSHEYAYRQPAMSNAYTRNCKELFITFVLKYFYAERGLGDNQIVFYNATSAYTN